MKNGPLTTGEAMAIVNEYGAEVGATSFLECMEMMDDALKNGQISRQDQRRRLAYSILIDEMTAFCG